MAQNQKANVKPKPHVSKRFNWAQKVRFLELPNEMVERISTFLDARSLARLGRTCTALLSVSNIDTLWHNLCQKEYGVSHKKGWNLTYKQIYTKILHPYPILGFKRLALMPNGGLLHIMWAESEIKVSRIYSGKLYTDDLVMEPAFSLTWDRKTKKLDVQCVHNPEMQAPAAILKDGPYFMLQCENKKCYQSHKRSSSTLGNTDSVYTDIQFLKGFTDHPGLFKSFKFSKGYNCPILPLEFPPTPAHFPVTPGLYKVSYGYHGVELIQVKISESNPHLLEGMKIMGDVNVPAGNLSFKVYLDKPIRLTEDEQGSCTNDLKEADELRPEKEYRKLFKTGEQESWHQPLNLPIDNQYVSCPPTCVARYLGEGRTARHFYNNPQWIKVHFIKFDNDTFGILWLNLASFSMFEREKDVLKQMVDVDVEKN